MSEDRSRRDRFDRPWTAGLLLFGLVTATVVLGDGSLSLFYPAALVGAGLLLARRGRGSPVALAGCAGLALGGVLEAVAVLGWAGTALAAEAVALLGFVVYLVGRSR